MYMYIYTEKYTQTDRQTNRCTNWHILFLPSLPRPHLMPSSRHSSALCPAETKIQQNNYFWPSAVLFPPKYTETTTTISIISRSRLDVRNDLLTNNISYFQHFYEFLCIQLFNHLDKWLLILPHKFPFTICLTLRANCLVLTILDLASPNAQKNLVKKRVSRCHHKDTFWVHKRHQNLVPGFSRLLNFRT